VIAVCFWGGAIPQLGAAPPLSEPGSASPGAGPHVISRSAHGLTVEWVVPGVKMERRADGATDLQVDGARVRQVAGEPQIPFFSTLVAVPKGTHTSVRTLTSEDVTLPSPGPVALAPMPDGVLTGPGGVPVGGKYVDAERASWQPPQAAVEMVEAGTVRGVRLERLIFYPAIPTAQGLRVTRRVVVEVSWVGGVVSGHQATVELNETLLGAVEKAVLNPWDVEAVSVPGFEQLGVRSSVAASPAALVEVDELGLYRVDYSQLAALGFAGIDPSVVQLLWDGAEVALEFQGDSDGIFEPGEQFLFYAEPRPSRWIGVDVYRLVVGAGPGLRMQSRNASPGGLTADVPMVSQQMEQNRIYTPDCFCNRLPEGRDGDRWAWEVLRRPDRATLSIPFDLRAVDASVQGELLLWLIGYTNVQSTPDHHVSVSLNGVHLGELKWDGKRAITGTLEVPGGTFRNGSNSLGLSLPGLPGVTVEGVWLDGFQVWHGRSGEARGDSVRFGQGSAVQVEPSSPLPGGHRVFLPLVVRGYRGRYAYTIALQDAGPFTAFDVTDIRRPQKLTGYWVSGNAVTIGDPVGTGTRSYFVAGGSGVQQPTRVRAPQSIGAEPGADILIVTHPDFAPALGPLVNLRASQGLTTKVANVLGIYDQPAYGDGRPDPEAIRAFIKDAYDTWNPRPQYLLLVGDGSFDPRQYRSESPRTFVPPYLADVDPWAGETAADNRYVCVDGDDALPDILLGRLPVGSLTEAQAAVNKIVAYETTPAAGTWNQDVILVADDTDYAGNFPDMSQAHAETYVVPPSVAKPRYCAGGSPSVSDCPFEDTLALKTGMFGDWNDGAALLQFTGHSSWQQWAAERFFHLEDIPSLANGARLPVLVEMTCFTSAFQRPEATLDEELFLRANGGVVGTWGPTGLGVGTGHENLTDGFFEFVFTGQTATLGEAALAGKMRLAADGHWLDLLDTFTILGDPALRINVEVSPTS
jgi:hypothetical protein